MIKKPLSQDCSQIFHVFKLKFNVCVSGDLQSSVYHVLHVVILWGKVSAMVKKFNKN